LFHINSNERVAEMIMDAYPQAVGEINNASGTPLHLACCETNASPSIVQKILQMQLSMDIPFNMFDSNGEFHDLISFLILVSFLKKIIGYERL
jgi:hypothetical protein